MRVLLKQLLGERRKKDGENVKKIKKLKERTTINKIIQFKIRVHMIKL